MKDYEAIGRILERQLIINDDVFNALTLLKEVHVEAVEKHNSLVKEHAKLQERVSELERYLTERILG